MNGGTKKTGFSTISLERLLCARRDSASPTEKKKQKNKTVIQTYFSFVHRPNCFTMTTPVGKMFAVVPFLLLLVFKCLKQEVLLLVNVLCV
jgi:hypothetical protein